MNSSVSASFHAVYNVLEIQTRSYENKLIRFIAESYLIVYNILQAYLFDGCWVVYSLELL